MKTMLWAAAAAAVIVCTPAPASQPAGLGGNSAGNRVATAASTGLTYRPMPAAAWHPGSLSDARLKTNVRTLDNALNAVLGLRGVSFYWNSRTIEGKTMPSGRQMGLIAQETQRVVPEVVTADSQGYLTVQYADLVPVLVEAIKEQQRQIDTRDADITRLRQEADDAVKDLQTRVAALEDALNRTGAAGAYPNYSPYSNPYGYGYPQNPGWRVVVPGVLPGF